MFTPDPIQRPAGPLASGNPMRDYLSAAPLPGVDSTYAVLPRSLVEAMPLLWQQHMAHLLAEFHRSSAHLNWPVYRVVPSRFEKLVDLDEEQLAEVGVIMEIDSAGDLVYRERSGALIDKPEDRTVLVACVDPIPAEHANATLNTPPRGFPQPTFPPSGPLPVQQAPHAPQHAQPPVQQW